MIRVGAGQSGNPSTARASEEAAGLAMKQAGIGRADAAVVFGTAGHFRDPRELCAALKRVTGTDQIVGSSGAGVLTGEGEIEGSDGLAVLAFSSDRIRARPFLVRSLRDRDTEAGAEIVQAAGMDSADQGLLLLLPDAYNGQPQRMLESIERQAGFVPVIGAGSSEDGRHGATYQLCGDEVANNAVAGLRLSGDFECSIEITQGCQPVTEPMVVTKAQNNLIFEIDNRPAFEVFARVIKGPLLDDLRRALTYVFVGLPSSPDQRGLAPGQYLVRNIVGLDPSKGILAVSEQVREGAPLIFTLRDPQRAREDLSQMLDRQSGKLAGGPAQFGIYFNCCARGTSLYGIPGIDTAYIKNALGRFPLIGFFGGFEIAPLGLANHLLAYTGVLALVRERG